MGDGSLTCPAWEGLAPGGWDEALPRPAPSAGVPLAHSIEQMFIFVKAELDESRDRLAPVLPRGLGGPPAVETAG